VAVGISQTTGGFIVKCFLIFLSGLFFVFCNCNANCQNPNTGGREAKYFPTAEPGFRTEGNARFNFLFDIPKTWRAVDISVNGDGYVLIPDNGNRRVASPDIARRDSDTALDIRIYGSLKILPDSENYAMLTTDGGSIENFRFRDGTWGKLVRAGKEKYYIRSEEDVMITLYSKADRNWLRANEATVRAIARSIRRGRR
jgi:hypothetical protein